MAFKKHSKEKQKMSKVSGDQEVESIDTLIFDKRLNVCGG
jgi:hypothetical protein